MVMNSWQAIQNGPGCESISQRRLRSPHLRLNSSLGRQNDHYFGFSFWPAEEPQLQATAFDVNTRKCSNQAYITFGLFTKHDSVCNCFGSSISTLTRLIYRLEPKTVIRSLLHLGTSLKKRYIPHIPSFYSSFCFTKHFVKTLLATRY